MRIHLQLATVVAITLLTAPAQSAVLFEETFEGPSLDPSRWTVSPGGGTLEFQAGRLTLSAPCNAQFPYVVAAVNPFPTVGDFVLRVGFRYPSPQAGGNGFSVSTPSCHGYSCLAGAAVWQDYCCGGLRVVVGGGAIGLGAAPQTGYRVYEWQYVSGTYHAYVNGQFIGGALAERPNSFWFGHPPYTYCPWTIQEIDFVVVETFEPTPSSESTWGRVKAAYLD